MICLENQIEFLFNTENRTFPKDFNSSAEQQKLETVLAYSKSIFYKTEFQKY
jgi:hypothetical protein